MSEAIPGLLFDGPEPSTPQPAGAVVLWREGARGREVFWVRRGTGLRFAGGFFAFPGGKVDDQDHQVDIPGAEPSDAAVRAAAARELFEEAGILLAPGAERVERTRLRAARQALLAGRVGFAELLADLGLGLDGNLLAPAGRWITPSFVPIRFDAHFYLAAAPPDQEAEVWPGELSDGGWVPCAEAMARWRDGRVLLHPPNRWAIQCLDEAPPPQCLRALRAPPYCEDFVAQRIDFQDNLLTVPLRTPTLLPATHTNTYVVGDRDLAVVDPGSPYPEEQQRLEKLLESLAAEGRRVKEIWITHHHADHIGGLGDFHARLGVPVRAHPRTADRLPLPCVATGDGDDLGGGWSALHTPGHARGHLCFWHEVSRALICGDMVSGLSTIVIDPPEGDMTTYIGQLERLRRLGPRNLFPAHGIAIPDAEEKLTEYLEHRRMREDKVLAALDAPGTLAQVTARAYDDTPTLLHPVAERSCLAGLEKLEREGKVRREGDRWHAS